MTVREGLIAVIALERWLYLNGPVVDDDRPPHRGRFPALRHREHHANTSPGFPACTHPLGAKGMPHSQAYPRPRVAPRERLSGSGPEEGSPAAEHFPANTTCSSAERYGLRLST
jgi:hypothetical protein